ncbi:hypothetical protein QBC38DRAFT_427006 [Podospora fimiseda]|uniref:Rhodopsin domain-containing protein n=1 Tax=Podospora fimiseda TaxID=252190 RepID=A0AAN7BGQ8_9PEZI|nr:hypothetical protein QBC38DRAFT_427006 [Podospora fimiseda]
MDLPPLTEEELKANKGPKILAVISAVSAVSTLFVAARVFVRGYVMRKLQLDDYIVIFALFFAWACVGSSIKAVQWGNGKHFAALNLEQMQNAVKYTIFGFPPGIMSFALPKFAAVLLLNRLMNPSKWHRVWLWFLAFGSQILLLGCVVILFAQCTPSAAQWNFSLEKKCWDPWLLVNYSIGAGSFSAFADLYLAIYPSVVLIGLQIELKKKIALCIALGIGSVASVVAIYKTTSLPSLAKPDFSWETSDLVIWTIIEGQTIIIASCIPLLQPLIDMAKGRRSFRTTGSSGYKHYGSGAGTGTHGNNLSTTGGGRRLGKRDPDATLLDTLTTRVDRQQDDVENRATTSDGSVKKSDSQESILPSDKRNTTYNGGHQGRIVRTHEVTVEYDASDKAPLPRDPHQPWRG